ncbi:hypothetical protein Pmani_038585 [Petrolisthes manimaculis]|uniref:Uncharacterized protein n=1 Tax=Petrolisthes manimaculis TaxID=1843537 RepID=A0AAE1TK93_9EUCA|nr:hypothetical protein Pmani_038585 [Petrolisthes manimaculis]
MPQYLQTMVGRGLGLPRARQPVTAPHAEPQPQRKVPLGELWTVCLSAHHAPLTTLLPVTTCLHARPSLTSPSPLPDPVLPHFSPPFSTVPFPTVFHTPIHPSHVPASLLPSPPLQSYTSPVPHHASLPFSALPSPSVTASPLL